MRVIAHKEDPPPGLAEQCAGDESELTEGQSSRPPAPHSIPRARTDAACVQ
jgi:hypothetical protein